MKSDQLTQFVHDARAAGHGSDSIRDALRQAGWRNSETAQALAAWADVPGLPPVPRPRPYLSAREALLFGLLFVSLGVISFCTCQLGFTLIDRALPDGGGNIHAGGVRMAVATLLTFVPLFLLLNHRVGRIDARDRPSGRSLVRRWLAAVSLLVAALFLLGDLAVTIFALLNGELTLRFILKALLVAVMSALVLAYYRDEMDDA